MGGGGEGGLGLKFFYLASLINMLCQQQALVKKKTRTACYYHNIIVLDLIVNYCLVM